MQHVQQRELPERISWARALIFAVGFFFIAAILIGQFPGFIYFKMTEANLAEFEAACATLAVVGIGGFVIIQVIVLLFDPKPLVPPAIFTVLGALLFVVGLVLAITVTVTGCTAAQQNCNQFFPSATTNILPILGGRFLWFQADAVDLVMVGIGILTVGLAMVFYSVLALREQRDPDRRDRGTTPAVRGMIIVGTLLLVAFLGLYTYVSDQGLAAVLFPSRPFFGLRLIDLFANIVLGASVLLTLGAFALRFHYLIRPVRKKAMADVYIVGAIGLAQTGVIGLLAWIATYPLLAWIHTWSFIGLNNYLTVCALASNIPGSCTFSQQAGYIVDAIITTNFLVLLLAAVWAWRARRNLVVIGSLMSVAIIGGMTLMLHTGPGDIMIALALTASMLVLATIWTSVARREFAVVGESKLGCLGQWLVVGTCLFIYIGSFAFFSLPVWSNDTEANILFTPGLAVPPPTIVGQAPTVPAADAIVTLLIMGVLALIQFYFLARNRYKV